MSIMQNNTHVILCMHAYLTASRGRFVWGRFDFVAGRDFYDGPANFCTSQSPPAGDSISARGDIWKGETLLHDTGSGCVAIGDRWPLSLFVSAR